MDKFRYVFPKYCDKGVKDETGYENSLRVIVAREQSNKTPVEKSLIIKYCKEYFDLIGMKDIQEIKYEELGGRKKRGFYTEIQQNTGIKDKDDIVWLRFTTDGFLGTVATSADINISYGTTSGRIMKYIGKKWDKNIIIFPLKNIPDGLNRQRIESGVGNYLIEKGVPILDYFSHNL